MANGDQNVTQSPKASETPLSPNAIQQAKQSGVSQEELRAEKQQFKSSGLTDPAAIGSILTRRRHKPAVVTTAPAEASLDRSGRDIDESERFFQDPRQGGPVSPDAIFPAGGGPQDIQSQLMSQLQQSLQPQGETGLTGQQKRLFDIGKGIREEEFSALEADTRRRTQEQLRLAETAQTQAKGSSRSALARMGALGRSTHSVTFMNKLDDQHRQEITRIQQASESAIRQARIAKSKADFEGLAKQMDVISQNREAIQKERDNVFSNIKKMNDIIDLQQERADRTIDAIAQSGRSVDDLPTGYLDSLDSSAGYPPGTSAGLFEISRDEAEFTRGERSLELQEKQIDIAKKANDIFNSVQIGTQFQIGDDTFFGTGTNSVEIGSDGLGRIMEVDQATGQVNVRSLGFMGAPKDNWQQKEVSIGGQNRIMNFNPRTGEYKPAFATTSEWDTIIPEGEAFLSPNFVNDDGTPMPFQCGELVNQISQVSVGSTIEEKRDRIDNALTPENVKIGDVIVTDEGTASGHVSIINNKYQLPDGRTQFTLTEANFSGPGVVTHTRTMTSGDPKLEGFIRGNPIPEFSTGSDGGRALIQPKVTEGGDDLLSVAEAKQLGLPFGTTRADAASQGITPTTATTGKPPSTSQFQAATFADRTSGAQVILNQVEDQVLGLGAAKLILFKRLAKSDLTRGQVPDFFQRHEQAQRDFTNSVLRRESGAAIAESEFENAAQQYFPQPGDSQSVIDQKRSNRQIVIDGLKREAGSALTGQETAAPPTQSQLGFSTREELINSLGLQDVDFGDATLAEIEQAILR